jgi:CubicO group peptidase (beta-lactamase class C family)
VRQADFKNMVDQARQVSNAPSVAAGAAWGGQVWYHCAGQRGLGAGPADADTVYPIASSSKAFIASCVMMLVDEGRLELDAPVKSHLPELELWSQPLTEQLTARDMLTHRSGLPRHDVTQFTRADATLPQTIAYLRYLEPAWELRQRFGYQNHMFALASRLVERLTGQPWGAVVRQRIFAPLGLTRAYTAWREYERYDDNYARPLITHGATAQPIEPIPTDSLACAGSLSLSLRDLLAWGRANLALHGAGRGKGAAAGPLALSPQAVDALHSPQMPIGPGEMAPYETPLTQSQAYGLGWFVERHRGAVLIHHGGTLRGFKSMVGFMPEHGLAVAVLANQNDSPAPMLLLRQMADAVLGGEMHDWPGFYLARQAERTAEELRQYREAVAEEARPLPAACAGVYEHPGYGRVRIASGPDGPRLRAGGRSYHLRPGAAADWAIDSGDVPLAVPSYFEGGAAFCAFLEPELKHPIRFERVAPAEAD